MTTKKMFSISNSYHSKSVVCSDHQCGHVRRRGMGSLWLLVGATMKVGVASGNGSAVPLPVAMWSSVESGHRNLINSTK